MLRNCILPSNYDEHLNVKCGEIICENGNAFVIHCEHCQVKLIDFENFIQHVRKIHLEEFLIRKPNFQLEFVKTEIEDEDKQSEEQDEDFSDDEKPIAFNIKTNEKVSAICLDEYKDCEDNNENDNNYEDEIQLIIERETSPLYIEHNNEYLQHDLFQESEGSEAEKVTYQCSKLRLAKIHACHICGKSYTTERTLKIHINLKHKKTKDYKCADCNEAFLNERSLQSHIKKSHTTYTCSECDRSYKSSVSLRVHQLTHKEIKDIICPYENCGKAFVSKRRLNVHLEVHTGKRNYVCEICGYGSRSKHALEVHKRGHTGEKPFKCPNCDRYFASKSLVNEHQAMHSKERPHRCDVCDATFARPKALYHHKHLHLSEKKFKCKVCGLAYAQAAGLSAHMRHHKLGDGMNNTIRSVPTSDEIS